MRGELNLQTDVVVVGQITQIRLGQRVEPEAPPAGIHVSEWEQRAVFGVGLVKGTRPGEFCELASQFLADGRNPG